MTQTAEITKTQPKHLFVYDTHNERVLVAKPEWFKTMRACELYNQYGLPVDNEHEANDGECGCEEVTAYNFFNGSNWQSVVIDAPYDTRYEEIADPEEIARYEAALEAKEFDNDRQTGYRVYVSPGFRVIESQWQGAWEMFTIEERGEDEK